MCIRDSFSTAEPRIRVRLRTFGQPDVEADVVRLDEPLANTCLLYTSDAADERSSVDLGGRRIIKKTNKVIERFSADRLQNNQQIWAIDTIHRRKSVEIDV
mgnify:CR=1 FL=1